MEIHAKLQRGDPVKTIQNIGALLNEVELAVRFIIKVEESLIATA
jgi:hypothetical protein